MIKLYETEIRVLDQIKQGKMPGQIAEALSTTKGKVTGIIARLCELTAVERTAPGHYRVVVTKYDVLHPENRTRSRLKKPKIAITREQAAYIRKHVKTVPRSQIAKALLLDKVTLNMMIIQLGLGRMD